MSGNRDASFSLNLTLQVSDSRREERTVLQNRRCYWKALGIKRSRSTPVSWFL